MAGMAAKLVAAFLESKETKVTVLEENLLRTGWNFEGGSVDIYFDFDETDSHVHVEGINFCSVPKSRYDNVYRALNECNNRFSHIKFVLNEERGSLAAREDAVIQLDTCGEECYELMIRMVQVVESAYPIFMKAIWA